MDGKYHDLTDVGTLKGGIWLREIHSVLQVWVEYIACKWRGRQSA